jgi:1-deoxy-D-xylulose-5-phosphate reductoisomerase
MKGGTYPTVLCAADEVAIDLFLSGRIKFVDIAKLVEQTLEQHQVTGHPTLEEIMTADAWAREQALQLIAGDNLCGLA